MDIEESQTELKSRKDSCSTMCSIEDHSPFLEDEIQNQIVSHKKMGKSKKIRKSSSCRETQINPFFEDQKQILIRENQRIIFGMIKELHSFFNFHIDTYLVCLKLANLLKFNGDPFQCIYIAGSICLMVDKVYESLKVSFDKVKIWSGQNMTLEIYEETESVILEGLNFQIPILDASITQMQIQSEIDRIEAIYS